MPRPKPKTTTPSGATVGYEQQLWQTAIKLRGSMDAAEYKHVVLGLIFLKLARVRRTACETAARTQAG